MDWLDLVQLAITALGVLLMALYVGRQALARSRAASVPAIEARVVSVARTEGAGRVHRWFVDTRFEVPGHGVLQHRRGCETEGQAILWSRRYKEGSSHLVVPNSLEADTVFVADELRTRDWPMWVVVGVMGVLLAWAVVEYWAHD